MIIFPEIFKILFAWPSHSEQVSALDNIVA